MEGFEDIVRYLSDEDAKRDYIAWLNNPTTKTVIELLSGLYYPQKLDKPDGGEALYKYGLMEGGLSVLMLLKDLTKIQIMVKQAESVNGLEMTYAKQ